MQRGILVLALTAALVAAACGGGDKEPRTAPTSTPDTDAKPTATRAAAGSTPSASSSLAEDNAISDLMGLMFNSGMGEAAGGAPPAMLGAPDPELGQYLLKQDDLPDGYTLQGEFSVTAPDDGTELAGARMAASIFTNGDPEATEPGDASMLMSMIIRPEDPSVLADAFAAAEGGFTQEELMESLGGNGESFPGLGFTDVSELDTDGLGENAAGLGMTLDMSGFFGAIAEAFGGEMSDDDRASMDAFSSITIRMYLFERDGTGAAVMRIAFGGGDTGSASGDLALARTVHGRLD